MPSNRCGRWMPLTLGTLLVLATCGCTQSSEVSVDRLDHAGVGDVRAARACQTWLDDSGPSATEWTLRGAMAAKLDDAHALALAMGADTEADPLYDRIPGDHATVLCAADGPVEKLGLGRGGTRLIFYVVPDLQSSGLIGVS